jgi:hypothetical protein
VLDSGSAAVAVSAVLVTPPISLDRLEKLPPT